MYAAVIRNKRGVTLVELIIASVGIALLGLVLAEFLGKTSLFIRRTNVRTQLINESREAMNLMSQFLKKANPQTVVLSTPIDGDNWSQIDFDLAQVVPTLSYRFVRSGNELHMRVNTRNQILSKNCTGLTFSYPAMEDPTLLQIALEVALNADATRQEKVQLTQIVKLSPT